MILLRLERRARHAENLAELSFIIVNETLRLVSYRQAILWEKGSGRSIRIKAVSGVDRPDPDAPFVIYMRRILKHLLRQPDFEKIRTLQESDLKEDDKRGWTEWAMGTVIWCPLMTPAGEILGGLIFTRGVPWNKEDIARLEHLADAYAHAWQGLNSRKSPWRRDIRRGWRKRLSQLIWLLLVVFLMGLPVRLSVLAPAEIVPSHFLIVSVPMDGVIQQFHVAPDQEIEAGQPLFRLDDTAFRNEYEVAKRAVSVARAAYKRTAQKAFADKESRGDLLLLKAQVEQKSAELDYMTDRLARSEIVAEQAGLAVFGDVNDWLGKPVATGEKVMTIADPNQVEAEIQLPVEDAINLEKGADVLIFLNVEPDRPLPARLRQASYEAQVTPEGTLAFRLKATLIQKERIPRIGLRGTAKIYGKEATLFYYLMRRPLTALRQYLGMLRPFSD